MSNKTGMSDFLAVVTIVFLFLLPSIIVYVGDSFPVLQKLVIFKTPAENEGPTPIKGVASEKWEKEFSYRLTGELKNFDEKSYRTNHPGDIIIFHRDGATTIYAMKKPSKEEIGRFRNGPDL